jgi:hypothetical protein
MGLLIDEFYKLTPRQFHNVQSGFYRRKEDELKIQLILNRGLKFAVIKPHLKDQNATEEVVYPLYFEDNISTEVNLEKQKEIVEQQKIEIWSRIDAMKKGDA